LSTTARLKVAAALAVEQVVALHGLVVMAALGALR
jgi:hypothetical protein